MAGHVNPEITTKAVLKRMLEEKLTIDEMAAKLGVHRDSIRRGLRRHRLREVRPPRAKVTLAEAKRIRELAAEGMPATWIAEDLHLHDKTVRGIIGRMDPFLVREWKCVWSGIRHDDDLYHLHRQFAPAKKVEIHSMEMA